MFGLPILELASATLSAGLALATAGRARRSFPRWAFVIGMLLLGADCILSGLSRVADGSAEIGGWQSWRFLVVAAIPGTWLLFSLSYAREKRATFATATGGYALAAALAIPTAVAYGLREKFVASMQQTTWGTEWLLRLGFPGMLLFGMLLVCSVGVIMNLERTFRASVGTVRWRIKFMLLGVGLIFVVRIYTSSQVLLFRGFNSSLDILNSGALLVGSLLMLRSLVRTGHFDLEVYPSQSVLQNSVTVLLAGAYLLIIGLLEDGAKRFSELQRSIGGISQKMLTQTLRNLERDGLVSRKVTPTVPPRGDYALTELGRDLLIPVSALGAWAIQHTPCIEAARAQFDASETAETPQQERVSAG